LRQSSDAVGSSDQSSSAVVYVRNTSDNIGSSERSSATVVATRSQVDAVGVSDQSSSVRIVSRASSDAFGVSEKTAQEEETSPQGLNANRRNYAPSFKQGQSQNWFKVNRARMLEDDDDDVAIMASVSIILASVGSDSEEVEYANA
jgi:hypothetical protein